MKGRNLTSLFHSWVTAVLTGGPSLGITDAMASVPERTAVAHLFLVTVWALSACTDAPRDVRFDDPEATIATLLGAFGVADMAQEEVQRQLRSRGRFELRDEETYHACFVDFDGPASEGLAGYVFGTIAAGKDQLRIARVGDKVHVYPDPDRRERYVVMFNSDVGYRISLRESVPAEVRRALLAEHERIDTRNRRAGSIE